GVAGARGRSFAPDLRPPSGERGVRDPRHGGPEVLPGHESLAHPPELPLRGVRVGPRHPLQARVGAEPV
ncbi:MAG: hypothetical protein AVDCRST_MAG02-14, partial [uncultured Rubrobacteraceae bacterium]